MNRKDIKDIAKRTLKTFFQAFVPILLSYFKIADYTDWDNIKTVGISALTSAAAAGLCAVWNLLIALFSNSENTGTVDGEDDDEKPESDIYVEDFNEVDFDTLEEVDNDN